MVGRKRGKALCTARIFGDVIMAVKHIASSNTHQHLLSILEKACASYLAIRSCRPLAAHSLFFLHNLQLGMIGVHLHPTISTVNLITLLYLPPSSTLLLHGLSCRLRACGTNTATPPCVRCSTCSPSPSSRSSING